MFALMLATDYEGEMILGIYSSWRHAHIASEAFITNQRSGNELRSSETFEIREIQLDAAAQYHW